MATSYCAVADVARITNLVIDGSSDPTSTETQTFCDARAAVLSALCARHDTTVSPNTFTAASDLGRMLIEANAIGAAIDYIQAQEFGATPQDSERATRLEKKWQQYTGLWDGVSPYWIRGEGFITMLIKGSLAQNHITSGAESEDASVPNVGYDTDF